MLVFVLAVAAIVFLSRKMYRAAKWMEKDSPRKDDLKGVGRYLAADARAVAREVAFRKRRRERTVEAKASKDFDEVQTLERWLKDS